MFLLQAATPESNAIVELSTQATAVLSTCLTAALIVLVVCFIIKYWPRSGK